MLPEIDKAAEVEESYILGKRDMQAEIARLRARIADLEQADSYKLYAENKRLLADRAQLVSMTELLRTSNQMVERLQVENRRFNQRFENQQALLKLIADIAEGSTSANSLPHIAKLARGDMR